MRLRRRGEVKRWLYPVIALGFGVWLAFKPATPAPALERGPGTGCRALISLHNDAPVILEWCQRTIYKD